MDKTLLIIFLTASSLTVCALLALAAWTVRRLQKSRAETESALADVAALQAALARQQRETENSTQSMKAANTLLAQASDRFQELFQGLPAACVGFDKSGRIMEWNRAFMQLYALPTALGSSIWETIYAPAGAEHLDEVRAVTAAVTAVFEGERSEGLMRSFRRPDGTLARLYCSIFPLREASGEIIGAISADIDFSAQHEAEDALRRSEERLHTLYNITSQQELSFAEKTDQLLTLGAAQFGLEFGVVARVEEDRYEIVQAVSPSAALAPGTVYAACDTYCAEALKRMDAVSFEAAGATEQCGTTAYRNFGLEAYIGTPIRVGGKVWGMLCFAGTQPYPRLFTSGDRELLRLMAQWAGGEIARQEAENAIRESEERFRTAIASISEGLIVMDKSGIVSLWNDSAERILGMTQTEMHGLRPVNPEFAAVREDGTKFPQGSYPLLASLRRGVPQQNVVMGLPRENSRDGSSRRMLPGEMLWVSVNAKPLFSPDAPDAYAVVATFTDITERRRSADQITRQVAQITEYAAVLEEQKQQLEDANTRLEALAMHDTLTGLGNRRAFEQRLVQEMNQALRYGTPLSVLLLDVDLFKSYNDSFGHPAGDDILRAVAETLRCQGRETDFFARYGGEEFIIILPQTDSAGAVTLAERLRAAVEAADWPRRGITVSLGAATLTAAMSDADELVSAADQALYFAKSAGRNCVFHALSMADAFAPPLAARRP